MKVLTYETNRDIFAKSLLRYTCRRYNLDLTVLGQYEPWNGVHEKAFGFQQYIKTLSPDEYVLCLDCRDTFFQAGEKEIISKFEKLNSKIVFGIDSLCFPLLPLYKWYRTPYLNSGVYMGKASDLLEMFKKFKYYFDHMYTILYEAFGLTQEDIEKEEYLYSPNLGKTLTKCDQLMATVTYLLTNLITLDEKSELIQTSTLIPEDFPLYYRLEEEIGNISNSHQYYNLVLDREKKYIYNEVTNTVPPIIHAPGPKVQMSTFSKFMKGDYGQVATLF